MLSGGLVHLLLSTTRPELETMQDTFLLAVPPPQPLVLSHNQSPYDQMYVSQGGRPSQGFHSRCVSLTSKSARSQVDVQRQSALAVAQLWQGRTLLVTRRTTTCTQDA